MSDDKGKAGDVRDVIAIRALQRWEIGVSAKNNHEAVKHSRLSTELDFGDKWLQIKKLRKNTLNKIQPIFNNLQKIRTESNAKKLWKETSKSP